METLNRGFNIIGDLVSSIAPDGIKAGELGPNYALLYYVAEPVVGAAMVVGMMTGYTFRALQELVLSQPDQPEIQSGQTKVGSTGITGMDRNPVSPQADLSQKGPVVHDSESDNTPN